MIDKLKHEECCGCSVCHDVCPVGAIEMKRDNEWFLYPSIDPDICIKCDLCEKNCPALHHDTVSRSERDNPPTYAANHKSYEVRFGSTSGGVFSALATQILREGGYVGGAVATPEGVKHILSNDPEDLPKLRRSKYTPSDAQGFYKRVKELLKAGEKVLAVGTPCMIAGLRLFLRKDYDNLVTADFVCNNLLSPRLFNLALDYEARMEGSPVIYTHTKDKEISWDGLTTRYDFKNGRTIYRNGRGGKNDNIFNQLYHSHIGGRPSCEACLFKGFPRYADISMGDYWGLEKYHPALNDDMGTSLVMLNSAKGEALFENVKGKFHCERSKKEWAVEGNPAFLVSPPRSEIDREAFFRDLDEGLLIEQVLAKYSLQVPSAQAKKEGLFRRFKRGIRCIKRTILPMFKKYCGYGQTWRFIKLNFLTKRVRSNWRTNALIYPSKYSLVEIQKGATLALSAPLIVGAVKQKGCKVETRLLLERNSTMTVSGNFVLGYGSDVEVFPNATLEVETGGANCFLTLICAEKITLKGTVMIGRNVSIRDTNAHVIALEGYKVTAPVLIEDHSWLCSGCNINPGVHVGIGSIVGGMANVSCRVPAHSLVLGNPAKVVMKDIMWKY